RRLAQSVANVSADKPVWNTESASAQCGGQAGFSDRMVDAIWQTDWLGLMAEEGTSLVVRHSLVGADYSLLAPDTFEPRPTFLATAWMRRHVRNVVFATEVNREELWARSYCGVEDDVTVVMGNPYPSARRATVEIGSEIVQARAWSVSSADGLTGAVANVNGAGVAEDGTMPNPPGFTVETEGDGFVVEVAPASVLFVSLDLEAAPALCEGP
ncbi:MAG: hypothetical protein AAGA56_26250, partial [Myxococcota bacterium]